MEEHERTPEEIQEIVAICEGMYADCKKGVETMMRLGYIEDREGKDLLFNIRRQLGLPPEE